jgi:hypothetical protein
MKWWVLITITMAQPGDVPEISHVPRGSLELCLKQVLGYASMGIPAACCPMTDGTEKPLNQGCSGLEIPAMMQPTVRRKISR